MNHPRTTIGPALWLGLLLAASAYLYRLDSLEIPGIGDEMFYVQIARVTAAQGRLLPLVAEHGVTDTKPPLLFWQGILSTGWGGQWDLWHLRLPVVLYSFLTAGLVGYLAARLSQSRRTGCLAALIYLGCWSTFQHGRPFLVNAPETFFLFLPLVLLLVVGRFTWLVALISGVSLGLGSLYKSFFLIVPVAAALGVILWSRSRGRTGDYLRRQVSALAAMGGLGLAIFSLWFVFDPYPGLIVEDFIVKENVAKLRLADYVKGVFAGPYPVWHIWLGDFWNAGLYAFPLLGLVWQTLRRLRSTSVQGGLAPAEADLWRYVLAFLVVYSVPSQRQENYLLPTVAALSVLLALNWERIPSALHRAGVLVAAVCLAVFLRLTVGIARTVPAESHPWIGFGVMGLLLVVSGFALSAGRRARALLPSIACGTFLSVGIGLSAFDLPFQANPEGPGLEALAGRTVYVPAVFNVWQERYRFLLPRSEVVGYNARVTGRAEEPLGAGMPTAVWMNAGAPLPAGYVIYGQRWEVRHRLPDDEIAQVVFHSRIDLWVRRLVILEKKQGG